MSKPQEKLEVHYTYADYLTWDDDVRYELIDGVAYALAAPSRDHQVILGELHTQFNTILKNKDCKPFMAPSDVRLNVKGLNDDVFQPDLFVICDKSKFNKLSYIGAPELIIEIISPSTAQKDRIKKYQKYLEAKVKEYWIVDPISKSVSVFILENDRYMHSIFSINDKIPVSVLKDCVIDMKAVFDEVDTYKNMEENIE
ncbi:MAG: Uma2 family endonuclease [Candidatus Cloacimonetes bacterium]|nr:Uma2 family endonuclease [Candidatus Cloacimonadota bacterium]